MDARFRFAGSPTRLLHMGDDQAERCRRDPVDPLRGGQCCRPPELQLLLQLVRQAGNPVVIEVLRVWPCSPRA